MRLFSFLEISSLEVSWEYIPLALHKTIFRVGAGWGGQRDCPHDFIAKLVLDLHRGPSSSSFCGAMHVEMSALLSLAQQSCKVLFSSMCVRQLLLQNTRIVELKECHPFCLLRHTRIVPTKPNRYVLSAVSPSLDAFCNPEKQTNRT